MKIFKTALAMKCNEQQFESIKPKLEGLGYRIICNISEHEPYLTNNYGGSIGNVTSSATPHRFNRIVFEAWNEELFLALAAMVAGDVICEGEWGWSTSQELINYSSNPFGCKAIKKATAEQLIAHFTEETTPDWVKSGNWCIKQSQELEKWGKIEMQGKCNVLFNAPTAIYHIITSNIAIWDCDSYNYSNRTLITFDQFYKYIYLPLKNKTMETKTVTFKTEKEFAKALIDMDLWDKDGIKFYSIKNGLFLRFLYEDLHNNTFEMKELWERYNQIFYTTDPTIKPVEVTMQQIADKMGIKVENLRIKDHE